MKTTPLVKDQKQRRKALAALVKSKAPARYKEEYDAAWFDAAPSIERYKPKEGLEVISFDWGFIRQQQNNGGVFLLEGRRVHVVDTRLIYGLGDKFLGWVGTFGYEDIPAKSVKITHIPENLIYCTEYELVREKITGIEFVHKPHSPGKVYIEVDLAEGGRAVYGVYDSYEKARMQLSQIQKRFEIV